jgi:serine/threonine protein kinase
VPVSPLFQLRASNATEIIKLVKGRLEGLPLTALPQPIIVRCSKKSSKAVHHGGAAEIYQAELDGKLVALKLYRGYVERMDGRRVNLSGTDTPANFRSVGFQVCREALLWKQLRHPNILPLLGIDAGLFSPRLCLVSPWSRHGNIAQYMKDPDILEAHVGKCVRI